MEIKVDYESEQVYLDNQVNISYIDTSVPCPLVAKMLTKCVGSYIHSTVSYNNKRVSQFSELLFYMINLNTTSCFLQREVELPNAYKIRFTYCIHTTQQQ